MKENTPNKICKNYIGTQISRDERGNKKSKEKSPRKTNKKNVYSIMIRNNYKTNKYKIK